jgi:hypothetical protein
LNPAGSTSFRYASYPIEIEWAVQHFGEPDESKQVSEFKLHFRTREFRTCTFSVATEVSTSDEDVTFEDDSFVQDGDFAYAVTRPEVDRALLPPGKQRGALYNFTFSIREAMAIWQLLGVSFEYNIISPRVKR